jgi:crotonobetainyl-CoA:carnitine CoA-transferase CaiB-like acyl-CoA transferase
VTGSTCTRLLADIGAEVFKVEPALDKKAGERQGFKSPLVPLHRASLRPSADLDDAEIAELYTPGRAGEG